MSQGRTTTLEMLDFSDVTGSIIDPEKKVKMLADPGLFNTQRLVKFVKFDTLRSKSLTHHFSVLFIKKSHTEILGSQLPN